MRIRFILACLCALLLTGTACGGDETRGLGAQPTALPATSARPAGTATSQSSSAVSGDATGPLPQLKLQRVSAITFKNMTGMYEVPGIAGRFLVLEKSGRIQSFDIANLERTVQILMDIEDRVDDSASELGLLGLAFAPDFATSRAFYVNYTAGSPLRTVVSRFTADAGLV